MVPTPDRELLAGFPIVVAGVTGTLPNPLTPDFVKLPYKLPLLIRVPPRLQRSSRTRFGPSSKIVNWLSTSLPSSGIRFVGAREGLDRDRIQLPDPEFDQVGRQRQRLTSESKSRDGVERNELKLIDEPPGYDRQISGRINLGRYGDPGSSLIGRAHRHMYEGCWGSHLLVICVSNHQIPRPGNSRGEGMRTSRGGSFVTSPT